MTGHLVLLTIVALANVGLGAIVLSRDFSSGIYRSFAAFSFSVATWTLSNGLVSTYADTPSGYLWGRLAFASASIIPVTFLLFTAAFPSREPAPPPRLLAAFLLTAAAAFAVSLTPLMLKGTTSENGVLRVIYGPLHLPFGLYFISCLGFSLYILTRKLTLLTGLEKLRVRYLFAAVLTAALGATVTNLVIPLAFGSSQFSRYGPLFGLLMIAIIAHAIIRYRLMDIRVVIRKGVVYVIAITASASFFFSLAQALNLATGYRQRTIPVVEALVLAVIVAIFFQPLKQRIQDSLNQYVYRQTYDYQRTIREASRRLSAMLDLRSLLDYLAEVIQRTFKVELVSIYLQDDALGVYTSRRLHRFSERSNTSSGRAVSRESALVVLLTTQRQTVMRDEAPLGDASPQIQAALEELRALGGDIALPMFQERTLLGFLIVGTKRSGDPYFAEDIDLLSTLLSQAAVAMNNAQLYQQVVLVNEYVDNILSTMESGVIAVDASGRISLFNSAAERLTGFRSDALKASPATYLPPALALPLQDTLTDGTPRSQFEITIQGLDGLTTPLVCSTGTLKDRDGSTHGALIVFSDLTRLRELEREKRRAERLASFGALASGVAHEIKNPLVAIRTFAELLPERFEDADFREDFSKVVIKEIARIDDLVARLRGIAATAPQQVGAVDIREPITDTLALLRGQLEQTNTRVHREFLDPAPFVAIDDSQLKQLFLNLFLNALEAMGSGGHLTIRVSRTRVQGSPWIAIEVSDTGPGIPEAVKNSIFDPFFTTKVRGSGLGLTICRGIMDAHRGTIRAEGSSDHPGTTIVLEFPAAVATPELVQQNTR